jgi:hypothetical protein
MVKVRLKLTDLRLVYWKRENANQSASMVLCANQAEA